MTYLLPIFGLFWGWQAGETITPRVIGALAIVLFGVLIVNGGADRLLARKTRHAEPGPVAPRR
ncbi:MAG: hypothetical protein M3R24_27925 [Chloroflexota bacterium]|nr:hypothetical protein [Chloroflexota bacterium]